MNDERLRSYLQDRLGGYSHPVDDELWSRVNGEGVLPGRNTMLPVVIAVSMAALVILAVILFKPSGDHGVIPSPIAVETPLAKETQEGSALPETPESEVEVREVVASPPPRAYALTDNLYSADQITSDPELPIIADPDPESEPDPDPDSGDSPVAREERSPTANPNGRPAGSRSPSMQIKPKNRQRGNVSMMLAVNGAFTSASGNPSSIVNAPPMSPPPLYGADGKPIDIVDPEYDFPVSFTVAVRKGITRRFSLESGLTYTYLHTVDYRSNTDIKLHYLGIPLRGVVTIYDHRRLSVYASAGGMVERQVSGKLKHPTGNKGISNSRLQWSVNGAAGVNIKLGDRAGLFAEPGLSYFFDDGTGIPTIRKDEPLNFNLQVGLRINFD